MFWDVLAIWDFLIFGRLCWGISWDFPKVFAGCESRKVDGSLSASWADGARPKTNRSLGKGLAWRGKACFFSPGGVLKTNTPNGYLWVHLKSSQVHVGFPLKTWMILGYHFRKSPFDRSRNSEWRNHPHSQTWPSYFQPEARGVDPKNWRFMG